MRKKKINRLRKRQSLRKNRLKMIMEMIPMKTKDRDRRAASAVFQTAMMMQTKMKVERLDQKMTMTMMKMMEVIVKNLRNQRKRMSTFRMRKAMWCHLSR